MKILIVDDDENMRILLRRYFMQAQCAVSEAATLDAAFRIIAEEGPPHLVTLDLNLGEGGEAATLDKINELKRACPDALVIVLTGVADISDSPRVIAAGAHAMMVKQLAPADGGFLAKLGRQLSALLAGPGPNPMNMAVAEALAARFSRYVQNQS